MLKGVEKCANANANANATVIDNDIDMGESRA